MKIGIVGAGITGLALTHALHARGVDVVTFEAAGRPGGVIRSATVNGRCLEYGPQRIRATPAVMALVEDLGLEDALWRGDPDAPLYVYADGALRPVPRSLGQFLRTDLLSWRGKLRVLREPFGGTGPADGSAKEYFEAKFGPEAYDRLLGPLFGGIYASNPARMPARHGLERVIALDRDRGSLLRVALDRMGGDGDVPPPITFAEGLATLPAALYEQHADRIELNTPVLEVTPDGDGGWELETSWGRTAVDHVVLTTPAAESAELLGELIDAPLARLTYNSLAIVHLETDAALDGFGYQTARSAQLHTRGVTWNAGLFDRDGVVTAFLGGMDEPDVLDWTDARLGSVAAEEFETVTGHDAAVLDVTRLPDRMPAYDDTWDVLPFLSLPDGITLATNYTGRVGVPSRIREADRVAEILAD